MDDIEITPHRKKKPQTSKSKKRSDHKHTYEQVVLENWIGFNWGKRCTVCNRFENRWSVSNREDFIKPEAQGKPGIRRSDCLSYEEIAAKYPGISIYKAKDTTCSRKWEYTKIEV